MMIEHSLGMYSGWHMYIQKRESFALFIVLFCMWFESLKIVGDNTFEEGRIDTLEP